MTESIPILWPDEISSAPASPIAILRAQQRPLRQKTSGILEAEIETTTTDKGQVSHQFDLIAPALNRARYRILYANHKSDLVYPVIVEAECFKSEFSGLDTTNRNFFNLPDGQRQAVTDEEFVKLVAQVLRSEQVRSLIQSLIARSNDQRVVSSDLPSPEDDETPE